MKVITSTLMAGEPNDVVWLHDLVYVETAEKAIAVIKGGNSALIAPSNWEETAGVVLRTFGSTEGWTRSRIHFAKTGKVLIEDGKLHSSSELTAGTVTIAVGNRQAEWQSWLADRAPYTGNGRRGCPD